MLKKGIELSDSGHHKQAMALFNKVSRSDTNYVWALYEKALTCEADSQYNEALKYCQEGLGLKEQRDYEPDIYNTYGNILNEMGQSDQAIKVFDTAIAKYPSLSLLYFNKGVAYLTAEKPADAETWFQKSLIINPYMYSAHYQLAIAALRQGKIIPSFLSAVAYLLMLPDGRYSSKSIALLAAITKSTDEILDFKNKRTEAMDESYQEIEDIVLSKIALEKEYKSIISIDDPISRQIQAVFEKIEYKESDKDFWMQYYIPYFKHVYDNKKFEPFIYHVFSNVQIKVIEDYTKRNKKLLDDFTADAADYFNIIRASRQLNYALRDSVTDRYYYENGKLVAKGVLLNKGKTLTGHWEFYYPAGNIKSRGEYSASGEREGDWLFYYASGKLKTKEHYANGKLEGPQESYFDNGNISSQENYTNNLLDGTATNYYYAGCKSSVIGYKLGKKDGEERKFYSNGNLQTVNNFVLGAVTGTSTEYFKSGKLEETEEFSNGKAEGAFKLYHENGNLSVEGQNVKDNGQGVWKYYYSDGKLKETRTYVNDVEEGPHVSYFENGLVSENYTTKKGKINGEATYFYEDGKLFAKCMYDNGAVKLLTYYDKAGKALSSSELKNNVIDIVSYSIDGHKKAHFFYNQKGDLNGPDTLFYPSGKINQINQYKNGDATDVSVSYYLNGNKKSVANMANGKENGYYESFYTNGKTQSEGWKQDGQSEGEWDYYDELGRLTEKYYYLDDEINGYKEDFLPNGQKTTEQKYHRGWLEKMTQFDKTGKVMAVDSFPKATGKYTMIYPGGQLMVQANYVNGDFDGPYKTYYFDGSLESSLFYIKGLKDSTYTTFYYGGAKDTEGHYKGGYKSGIWKVYEEDGKLFSTTPYSYDEMNGTKTYYFPNGGKDITLSYKDDDLDGPVIKYDPDGTLVDQVNFVKGSAQTYTYLGKDNKLLPPISLDSTKGVLKTYFPNGKPSRLSGYSDGVKNAAEIIYHVNGNVRLTDTTVYDISEGLSTEYYPNGKVKSEYHYLTDNVTGVCKEFNDKGILIKEMTFENGVSHGPTKYYNETGKIIKTMVYYYGTLVSVTNEK